MPSKFFYNVERNPDILEINVYANAQGYYDRYPIATLLHNGTRITDCFWDDEQAVEFAKTICNNLLEAERRK